MEILMTLAVEEIGQVSSVAASVTRWLNYFLIYGLYDTKNGHGQLHKIDKIGLKFCQLLHKRSNIVKAF